MAEQSPKHRHIQWGTYKVKALFQCSRSGQAVHVCLQSGPNGGQVYVIMPKSGLKRTKALVWESGFILDRETLDVQEVGQV